MTCIKCARQEITTIKPIGNVCASCFCEIIEKRVRKELREFDWVKKGERVLLVNDGSQQAAVGIAIFRRILGSVPVDIKEAHSIDYSFDRVVVPWSADEEVERRLQRVFEGKKEVEDVKVVHLMRTVMRDEIALYASVRGLQGVPRKRSEFGAVLDRFDSRYPGMKLSLLRGVEALHE